MTDEIRLEPLRWWHLAELAALDAQLFDPDVWSPETFWSELAAPGRWYTVALSSDPSDDASTAVDTGAGETVAGDSLVGDTVVGYAGLAVTGSEADIQTVAVAPAAQGRGLGRRLLAALVDEATARRARTLLLEVRADNEPAQSLYRATGFERIAVRRGYYQPGNIDAHIMRLTLHRPT